MINRRLKIANRRLEEMKARREELRNNGTELGKVLAKDMNEDINKLEDAIMEELLKGVN